MCPSYFVNVEQADEPDSGPIPPGGEIPEVFAPLVWTGEAEDAQQAGEFARRRFQMTRGPVPENARVRVDEVRDVEWCGRVDFNGRSPEEAARRRQETVSRTAPASVDCDASDPTVLALRWRAPDDFN